MQKTSVFVSYPGEGKAPYAEGTCGGAPQRITGMVEALKDIIPGLVYMFGKGLAGG